MVAEGLTAAETEAALVGTQVTAESRAAVSRLLEEIEAAEYGSAGAAEVSAMIDTTAKLVADLGRALDK
jgi:hypothetical protein